MDSQEGNPRQRGYGGEQNLLLAPHIVNESYVSPITPIQPFTESTGMWQARGAVSLPAAEPDVFNCL